MLDRESHEVIDPNPVVSLEQLLDVLNQAIVRGLSSVSPASQKWKSALLSLTPPLRATELWKELKKRGQTAQPASWWERSAGTTEKERCVLNLMLTPWPCWPRLKLLWKSKKKSVWFEGRAPKQADSSREVPGTSLRVRSGPGRSSLKQATRPEISWLTFVTTRSQKPNSEFTNGESLKSYVPGQRKVLEARPKTSLGFGFHFLMK